MLSCIFRDDSKQDWQVIQLHFGLQWQPLRSNCKGNKTTTTTTGEAGTTLWKRQQKPKPKSTATFTIYCSTISHWKGRLQLLLPDGAS